VVVTANGTHLTNLVAVPEPATAALLVSGFLPLVLRRKRT